MSITKLDIAEREIVTAVRLLFDAGDPIAAYVLAASARAITTALCEHRGVRSFMHDIQNAFPERTKRSLYSEVSASFFKHADIDPDAVLEQFDPDDTDAVLYIACEDFFRLCNGGPSELRAMSIWFEAKRGLLAQIPGLAVEQLVNIATKPRPEQLEMGKALLAWIRTVPALQMTYSTK